MQRQPMRLENSLTTEYVDRNEKMRSITEPCTIRKWPDVEFWWVVFGVLVTAILLICGGKL